MRRHRLVSSLLVALVVSACGSTTPSVSPPASAAIVLPSTSPGEVALATPTPDATDAQGLTATPTPEAVATPVPTAEPWKSHTSKRYKYTVRYPPDWVVTPGSSKLADQIDDYSSHFVYLSRDTVSGTISLPLTVAHDLASFKSHYKAKLLSKKTVKVNGWPGRLMTFDGSENGRKLYIQHLILGKGKVAYFVDMFTDRGDATADKALFKKIYSTFKPKS